MGNQTHPAYRGPWPRIRKQILQRDNYLCQIRGPRCTSTATHVDHIIPVTQGGPWWEPDNLRASCKNCNNDRIDRKRTETWRTANTHITLIVGPPGAGKTTYVQQHAKPDDLIIDYDQIKEALGNNQGHERQGALHKATMTARNALLKSLRQGTAGVARAWIISANPGAESMFPYHRVIVVDPGLEETLLRAKKSSRPGEWERLIQDWYAARVGGRDARPHSREW